MKKKQLLIDNLRIVNDYPKQGIHFYDIMPVLSNPITLKILVDLLFEKADKKATKIVALDARGFLLGGALAYKLGIGFVPVRKTGKLPPKTLDEEYDLEYGSTSVSISIDALSEKDKVIIVDDLIATGGTIEASKNLVEKVGAKVIQFLFFIELLGLDGLKKIESYNTEVILQLPA